MSLVLYSWIMHPSPALIRGSIDIIFIHDKKKILPQSRMTFSSSYILLFKYLDNYKGKYKNIRQVSSLCSDRLEYIWVTNPA